MIKYSKFTDNIGSGNFTDTFCQNTDKFQKSGRVLHPHSAGHNTDLGISLKLHSGEHISSTTEFQNYIALRKKLSVFGVILVRILPYLKIWTRITPNTDTFHAMLISIVKSALMLAVLQMKESSMNFLEVKLNIY